MPSRHPADDTSDTPLLDALQAHAGQGRVSFHMPGHAGGHGFPPGPLAAIGILDTTELVSTDDINVPEGPALSAMKLAAKAFGAGQTFFLTSGSTCGILAMLTVAASAGRTLLLPREVHRSVLHAIALTGASYRFIQQAAPVPNDTLFSPLRPPAADEVRAALEGCPAAGAVLICSPDYYGLCADLPAIAEAVHRAGALLIVDEAHGAHFAFGAGMLPVSAMGAGADLCVQSAHKTLPSLTQAALLHLSASAIRRRAVDPDRIREAIHLFQTSSPSFPIAASIDFARSWMQREGMMRIHTLLDRIQRFGRELPAGMHASPAQADPEFGAGAEGLFRDPLRLVIDVADTGIAGSEFLHALSDAGVDIEMADLCRLVCIPGLAATDEDFGRLSAALRKTGLRRRDGTAASVSETAALDLSYFRTLLSVPARSLHPRQVLLGAPDTLWTPLCEAAGRIAADALTPYPPGIPLAWPGEILDEDRTALIASLTARGISIAGVRAVSGDAAQDPDPGKMEIRTIMPAKVTGSAAGIV